jgi:hypothetical protein
MDVSDPEAAGCRIGAEQPAGLLRLALAGVGEDVVQQALW